MSFIQLTHTYQQKNYHLFIAFPQNQQQPAPAVMVFPDWSGCNDFARQKAQQLAQLGYVGAAIDVYGEGQVGQTVAEKSQLMTPLKENRDFLRHLLETTYTYVASLEKVNAKKIAAIGFCFGGLCALDLARAGVDLKGAVSFHGLLTAPDLPLKPINAKILILHGYADPMVLPDQVATFAQEMDNAHVDWQVNMYGHILHAFTNPEANDAQLGTVYHPIAAKRAWQAMENFLTEIFQ